MAKDLDTKWRLMIEAYKAEAAELRAGPEQEALLEKMRQLEAAIQMNAWLSHSEHQISY